MKLELRRSPSTSVSLAANENVDLIVEPGQIHDCSGDGAGKTTLMNVLYGMITPDRASYSSTTSR